jgi:hypothetical protein
VRIRAMGGVRSRVRVGEVWCLLGGLGKSEGCKSCDFWIGMGILMHLFGGSGWRESCRLSCIEDWSGAFHWHS